MWDDEETRQKIIRLAVVGTVVCVIGGSIWYAVTSTHGSKREAPPLPTLVALMPPPPPPPPPPKEPPPEPEKKTEDVPKTPDPKPADAPKQMTINGPAQAGSDAFGIGAGDGSGDVGSGNGDGFGEAAYSRYLGTEFQQAIQNDDRVNHLVFSADVEVWVDTSGHVTRASIMRTTGDAKTDEMLVAALEKMPALDQPPPDSFPFPQRISVRGKRPV
ncbi:MAG TPA: energy transducer TonB [Rhizomicrobium sp.]|jgi:protein TonB|nr:energy transducer TonB [Rhizomicrobium sp.]